MSSDRNQNKKKKKTLEIVHQSLNLTKSKDVMSSDRNQNKKE